VHRVEQRQFEVSDDLCDWVSEVILSRSASAGRRIRARKWRAGFMRAMETGRAGTGDLRTDRAIDWPEEG